MPIDLLLAVSVTGSAAPRNHVRRIALILTARPPPRGRSLQSTRARVQQVPRCARTARASFPPILLRGATRRLRQPAWRPVLPECVLRSSPKELIASKGSELAPGSNPHQLRRRTSNARKPGASAVYELRGYCDAPGA